MDAAAALFVQPTQIICINTHPNDDRTGSQVSGDQVQRNRQSMTYLPNLSGVITQLKVEYSHYKYTVYRCASKLVTLQKLFHSSKIPYKLVIAILDRHGIHTADFNFMIPPFQLTSLLHDIYYACEQLGHFTKSSNYHLETAVAVLANFFWNIYDPHRRHSISLLEIKVTFLILCKLYSTDQLVAEFYNLVGDTKTKCVSKYAFEHMLNILTKMISYIGEGKAYGAHNTTLVMEQCFSRCHNSAGLTELQFYCLWTTTQTRFLIYANLIALVKRIEDTEKLIHNNVCQSCNAEKIVGIRFKCQACKDLSLCLKCFATGYVTSKHIVGHRMYEVFSEDRPPKKFRHYFARLCNLFSLSAYKKWQCEEETKGFCNSTEAGVVSETELVTIPATKRTPNGKVSTNATKIGTPTTAETPANASVVKLNKYQQRQYRQEQEKQELSSLTGLTTTASNASNRLQSIIDRLLQQNAKLEKQLKCVDTATNVEISLFLSAHQKFLVDIINEMRNLSQSSTPSGTSFPTSSSTPHRILSVNQKSSQTPQNSFIAYTEGGEQLTHSICGADINRSYLEANKSDFSIKDLSLWFDQRRTPMARKAQPRIANGEQCVIADVNAACDGDTRETEMMNFKLLLHKVKEIVEDSYSDNAELSAATQNLENVLDSIIKGEEEQRRRST